MASVGRQRFERFALARCRRLTRHQTPLDQLVREHIAERGAIAYDEVIELALYHPEHGFYASGGQAGRRGDFLTSPEVGPLFGRVVANALDAEWDRLGQPEVFTVIDFGAGPGTLARSVLAAQARCADAMRYIAVERSVEQRSLHPAEVLSTDDLASVIGSRPVGVVIANELLDNMPFAPVRLVDETVRLIEVRVGTEGRLEEVVGGPHPDQLAFDPEFSSGFAQDAAAIWLYEVLGLLEAGRVIVIDYARLSSADVEVRTFANHERAGSELEALGTKDITIDVDLEQLQRRASPADVLTTQAEWLRSFKIDALVEEGRAQWEAGASSGGLAALAGRSRVREAEALTDPAGLGGFWVAEWLIIETD